MEHIGYIYIGIYLLAAVVENSIVILMMQYYPAKSTLFYTALRNFL